VILDARVSAYLAGLLAAPDAVLAGLRSTGEAGSVPIVSADTGVLLELLVRATGARRVIEVGTAVGVSTLHLARGVGPEGRVVSFDVDAARQQTAAAALAAAGVGDRVELRLEPGLDGLRTLAGLWDFAFLDAVKTEYAAYLDLVVPLLRNGGLVVYDNALMDGRVAGSGSQGHWGQREITAMRTVNASLACHPDLENGVVLAVGDGVGIAVRR
jgi:caffeoyl-CoA O-methyltransferase